LSIEFPYEKKRTYIGEVVVPKVTVEIFTKDGYRKFKFLIDTGADCMMLPRYAAKYIGIDLKSLEKKRSKGIEGHGINVYIGKIKVRIGGEEFKARCLFSERDDTPFLLGRLDIFDRFDIIFEKDKVKFIKRKARLK
jgi:predicted aspartyl protease